MVEQDKLPILALLVTAFTTKKIARRKERGSLDRKLAEMMTALTPALMCRLFLDKSAIWSVKCQKMVKINKQTMK